MNQSVEEYLLDNLNEKYLVHNIMYEYADLYTTSIDLLNLFIFFFTIIEKDFIKN